MRALLILLLAVPVEAASLNSGAAFLKIGTGARPTALGGAYTALAGDVDAIYYNPGGLAQMQQREFGATHTEYLLDTKFDFIGFAQPTRFGVLGLGVTRLSAGSIDGRNVNRASTSEFTASDEAYAVSFSRPAALLGSGTSTVGLSAKYLRSSIAGYTAASAAVDIGVQHRLRALPLSFGVALLNIGRGMQFIEQRDPLPLTISVGTAYRFEGLLNVALDVRHEPHDRRTDVGIGSEYTVLGALALRAGYTSQLAALGSSGAGPLGGLGGGLGLRMGDYRADYTFTPFGELGNVQRISLGAKF